MKALVLAGGLPQIKLINELKQKGIETILADYYPSPVAKPYADKFYQISTLDVPAITKLAKDENVNFLITVCTDQALLTVAKVSEELGLPCYIDYQTGLNVTNKQYMKQVFVENNISTAKHVVMGTFDEKRIKDFSYPLIVKPVDCNSSKGVRKVENLQELKTAFDDAVKLSRTKTAIVEDFISGKELSVDVYVENGIAKVLNISELEKIPEKDKFVIFRSSCLDNISEKIRERVRETAQQIADAFNLENSPMLIQMMSDENNVYVLEFSARTGGGEKFVVIEKVTGFDVIDSVIELTLGNKPHVDISKGKYKYVSTEFIYCKPGIFKEIKGVEELLETGIISDFYTFKWSGADFDSIQNSGDRVAGFTIVGNTKEELNKKHQCAIETLKVLDVNGQDIMRRDLLPKLKW